MKKHRSVAYTLDFLALGFVILAIAYHHNGENQSRTTAILSAVTHSLTAAYFHIQGHKDKPEHEKEQPETDAKIEDTPTQNPPPESLNLTVANQLLALRKEGKNKPEIIAMVWGVKPGKSRKYESAKCKFEEIQAYWESLGLW